MTSKDRILKDRQLSAWWSSIVNHENYDKFETIMQADAATMGMKNIDEMHGAMQMLESLRTVALNHEPPARMPSPGLVHDFNPKK